MIIAKYINLMIELMKYFRVSFYWRQISILREYERRGLDMSRWRRILTFWRRMTMKLMEETKKKKKNEAPNNKPDDVNDY